MSILKARKRVKNLDFLAPGAVRKLISIVQVTLLHYVAKESQDKTLAVQCLI